ncbi:hypoxanthine phosphoribosyltransferase [Thiocapsa imhoffii]|uniref:Hypoxanthine phosphoribosyltransferase n=1 Tax=Thiocapsa imhoffii TaxID=382777 RepID=A0A9X0WHP6_9GAMM|nr:hemerythrin domain-containing protein [Thiocapsa imhoffii]MBK1644743.1 hypoxanthine phosphoribosyltransferase [Thiocapsa imhoffii]
MSTLEQYRQTHTALRQMIEDLRLLLKPEQLQIRPNAKTAYELLCDLGVTVRNHLAEEDRSLYPSLLIHEDPKVKSIAWGFISGERPLRKTFDDYHKHWLKNCDFNFTEDFLAETHEILEMVDKRIEREEQVLFPKLIEIGLFQDPARPRGARSLHH